MCVSSDSQLLRPQVSVAEGIYCLITFSGSGGT